MAEEILYEEQIDDGGNGDPKDPLGLRKKLKQKPDPLGLRTKLQTVPVQDRVSSIPKIDYSKPVFEKMATESTAIEPGVITQKSQAANFVPTKTVADKFREDVTKAQEKVFKALTENDDVLARVIRQDRYDQAAREGIDKQLSGARSDMPSVQSAAMQVDPRLAKVTRPEDVEVTPEDITKEKVVIAENEQRARNILEKVAEYKPERKNEIQAAIYQLDVANSIQNDPEGAKRVVKTQDNVKKLAEGKLVYDWRQGRLIKPENIFQSALTGWKNKTQLFEDYDKFKKTENNDAIAMDLDARRTEADPDAPIPVPEGVLGELGAMAGGTPAKAIVGGAIGGLAGPEGAVAAGSIIGGREFAKLQYASTFQQVYYELRDQGMDGFQAVSEARKQADQAAEVGFLTGAAMGVVGARMGIKPLPRIALNEGFRKAVIGSLKNVGSTLSGATKEGLALGGIAAGGQRYLNQLAKDAGINRDIDEGTAESIESMLLFSLGMAAAVKGSKAFSPKTYRNILNGLSRADEGYVNKTLQEWVDNGQITLEQATKTKDEIAAFKKEDATIPANVAPEARIQILDKIKKREGLESQLESLDKAYHPEIKEKIKAIDEEITGLSKNKIKISAEENKINNLISDAIEEGKLEGVMGDIAKSDPEGFMKFVADQALGRNEDGSISSIPNADYAVRGQYGDAIVDKAIEMFPLQKKTTSSISVIRPEERTQPTETITIAPKEEVKLPDRVADANNKVFEGTIGIGGKDAFETSPDKIYRVTQQSQIDDISSTGFVRPPEGKMRGGKTGEVHWARGNDKLKYTSGDNKYILEVAEGLADQQKGAIPVEQLSAIWKFNKESGKWEDVLPEIKSQRKSTTDAVPVESADALHVRETPVNSGAMGEGVPKSEELAGEKIDSESQNKGEGQITPEDSQRMIGITHSEMNKLADELGLPEYSKDPETLAQWERQADERLAKNPNTMQELINKLREGGFPDKEENILMVKYIANLQAKYETNPTPELLAQINRTKNLFNIAGREWGKAGRSRQFQVPVEQTLADFHLRDAQVSGVGRLTEKQEAQSTKEYNKWKEAQKNWDAYNAKRIDELAAQKAEEIIKKMKADAPKIKKSHGDYVKERQDLIQSIKDKLKDARKDTSATFVPYAKELFAIAPDVAKLVKSLVVEGVEKLPEIIDRVHETLKEYIEPITKEDVRALIAGEYNEKKRTRSEITATIKDLKDQAALIGRLQELEAGVEPKNERAKIKRNQEIEELKQKIKEHDLTKLAASKSRMKSEIAKLEKDLAEGKYAPEEKATITLDKEGLELKDRLIQLRKEREIRLAEEQYAARTRLQQGVDFASAPFREVRTIKSSFDLSAPLRQGIIPTAAEIVTNPAAAGRRFTRMLKSAGSEKYMDRWLYDLKNSPEWRIMQESGLSIAEPGNISKKEEVFQSRLAERIPVLGTYGIKGSERAYAYWLNSQRVDLFRKGAEIMQDKGMTFENSTEAYKNWANTVNALTGRGELIGPFKNAAELLSMGLFSPRLIASRLSFFNPRFYKNIPAPLRLMVVKDMAKFIGLGMSVLALGKLAGFGVELDPRSSDFGKLRIGDTRYDIWGGFQQYVRLFATLFTQSKKTSSGAIQSLINEKDGSNKSGAVVGTFFRSKASPLLGSIINVATGEDVVGQPVTLSSEAKRFLLPILWEDVYKAAKDEGVKGALATAIPGIVGVGVQTYPSSSGGSAKKKPTKKSNKKKPIKK